MEQRCLARSGFSLVRFLLVVVFALPCAAQNPPADAEAAPASEAEMTAAAEKGDPAAQFALGEAYSSNRFDRDANEEQVKAVPWFRRAAERGHAEAMLRLAMAYGYGWGVKADGKLALEWARKAASAGSTGAMFMLAEAYHESTGHEQEPPALVDAVQEDDEISVEWFKKAAEAGSGEAFRRVATAYRSGKGAPKNPAKAVEWLKRGAEIDDSMTKGSIEAEIADILMKGDGVPKDEKAAISWLERAINEDKQGFYGQVALLRLAEAYQNGTGVKHDFAEARELLNQITEGQLDRAKQAALQKLSVAEKKAAAARAPAKGLAVAPLAWKDRTLCAPKGYEMLEPIDVFVGVDPFWVAVGDPLQGVPNLNVWRMAPGNTLEEVNQSRISTMGTSTLDPSFSKPLLRGSEQLGKISLGWVAWVAVSDKGWVEPGERRNTGAAFVYGAVSREEALKEGFAIAAAELKKSSGGPIRMVTMECGVSCKPDWEMFRRIKTITNGTSLPWGWVYAPSEKEMKGEGATVPQTPEAFFDFIEAWPARRDTAVAKLSPQDREFFRQRNQERFPYWDQQSLLPVNVPQPMMPEPVFTVVEEPVK